MTPKSAVRAAASLLVLAPIAWTAPVAAATRPVLGHTWAPNQKGYGDAHPLTVYNGGDGTGLVQKIRWQSWGGRTAIGSGVSTYVWPGTVTAANRPTQGARIVAFHLGTCHGQPSYNAVTWYFPKYGETFDPHTYINACNGAYVGFEPRTVHCPDLALASGKTATGIEVIGMSCAAARRFIATAPAARYLKSDGRFMRSGFRCGTAGPMGLGSILLDCQLDRREFLYNLAH